MACCSRSFGVLLRRLTQTSICRNHWRQLNSEAVDEQKSTMKFLNREQEAPLMVESIMNGSFLLNNGMTVLGPMALFPRTVLSWNVRSIETISTAAMSLFVLLHPRLECLVIGTGDRNSCALPVDVLKLLRSKRISVEMQATEHAVATFNYLNYENRCVAGGFLPTAEYDLFNDQLSSYREREQRQMLIDE